MIGGNSFATPRRNVKTQMMGTVRKLPSGNRTELWKGPPFLKWENPLFQWPFSIAM